MLLCVSLIGTLTRITLLRIDILLRIVYCMTLSLYIRLKYNYGPVTNLNLKIFYE